MHKPESTKENEMHEIDQQISARMPDKMIVKKNKRERERENVSNSGLCCLRRQQSKNKNKQSDK